METKTHLSLVIAGHLSSGKSTLCGRLYYEYGQIPQDELNKFKAIQNNDNNNSFFLNKEWKWLVEHQKNAAISPQFSTSCNWKNMETSTRKWTLIDCPGMHNKNTTTGGLQGDVLVLTIPANNQLEMSLKYPSPDLYYNNFNTKMGGSLRDAWINQIYRDQLLVVVTMMDEDRATPTRFSEARKLILDSLSKIGYNNPEKTVPIIPISARDGKNISVIFPEEMPWWSGCTVFTPSGREVRVTTLLNALEDWVEVPYRKINTGFRLPVFKHYPKKNILVGSVVEGSFSVDDEVVFIPEKASTTTTKLKISSMQMFGGPIKRAVAGDCDVGIQLFNNNYVPKRGQIMVSPNDILVKYPCMDIVVTVHVIHNNIKLGSVPLMAVHTATVPVKVKNINWCNSKSPNNYLFINRSVKVGDIASITITPLSSVVVDRYDVSRKLGTVFFFLSAELSMVGKVTDVLVGESRKSLKNIEMWLKIRLMFIGCYKDNGSSLRIVPKDVMRLICFYMWVLD